LGYHGMIAMYVYARTADVRANNFIMHEAKRQVSQAAILAESRLRHKSLT
jgi:hypothetical protein